MQHNLHKWNNKRLEMWGRERFWQPSVWSCAFEISPRGGQQFTFKHRNSVWQPRIFSSLHTLLLWFFFLSFGDFKHEKTLPMACFQLLLLFFNRASWTDGEGLEDRQEESDYKITFVKNPLPELPLVHKWSDLQVANCGRFAAQLKDIVTGSMTVMRL